MADDLLQLVLRQASLLGGCRHRVAFAGMGLAKSGDSLLHLLGAEADLGSQVLHGGGVRHLIEDAVQEAHRGSPSDSVSRRSKALTTTGNCRQIKHLSCPATLSCAQSETSFQAVERCGERLSNDY